MNADAMSKRHQRRRVQPIIRIFVSSTFTDLKHERDALQRDAFPRLEELCARRRFEFQAIDLRWGVPTEASQDHRTMRICLEELRRSQEVSPRPNFLILLGDRYGWRPLPEELTELEFRELEEAAVSRASRETLRDWYRRDENAVPSFYLLQSRRRSLGDGWDYTKDDVWKDVQRRLWGTINRAYPTSLLAGRFDHLVGPEVPLPTIVRMQASATEQEIWRGAFAPPNADQHVLAFIREIENLNDFPCPSAIRDFVDVDESGAVDKGPQAALRELKQALHERLGEHNVIDLKQVRLVPSNTETGNDVTIAHLAELCERVCTKLELIVRQQMDEYWRTSSADISPAIELKLELEEHRRFGEERAPASAFVGRKQHLQDIAAYLDGESNQPLVIHGIAGCGKTALLARAVQNAGNWAPVVRFIGTTTRSSDIRGLLGSLCQELRLRNPLKRTLPGDVRELSLELREHFDAAAAREPLIIFLDALDQLDEADNAKSLHWMPRGPIPPHVKLVVSCLSDRPPGDAAGQPFAVLQRRGLPAKNIIGLDALSGGEAETLLFERWLPQDKRTVNVDQARRIRTRLSSRSCRQPLYLKVLYEEVRLWRSYDPTPHLCDNVAELLDAVFSRLADTALHGPTVRCALGYIACARRGLTEKEVLEVLYRDAEYRAFLETIAADTRHRLPDNPRRIPNVIWSRLRFDLAPYLAERAAHGGTVIAFYHRQVAECVRGKFLQTPRERRQQHKTLAQYFHDQSFFLESQQEQQARAKQSPPTPRPANLRKVDELPWQRLSVAGENSDSELRDRQSRDVGALGPVPRRISCGASLHGGVDRLREWGELEKLLTNLPFLEAKAEAGMVFELAEDFARVLRILPAIHPGHRLLCLLEEAVRRDIHFIARHPTTVFQCLWNSCWWYDCPQAEDHYELPAADRGWQPPWKATGPKVFRVLEAMLEEKVKTFPQHRWLQSVRPPQVPLGSPLVATLRGPDQEQTAVLFSPNGRRFATVGQQSFRLWDSETGEEVLMLGGEHIRIAFTGGDCSVAIAEGPDIRIRDGETGYDLALLQGHTGEVDGIWLSPNGYRLFSHSWHDGTARLWNVEDGTEIKALKGQKWKMEFLAFSPDGSRIVFQDRSGSWLFDRKDQIRVWDIATGVDLASMQGSLGTGVFSSDGTTFATLGPSSFLSAPRSIRLIDLHADKEKPALREEGFELAHLALSSDGSLLAAAGSNDHLGNLFGRKRFPVLLWNTATGAANPPMFGHRGKITSLAFSPDGKLIATGSKDRTVRLWSTAGEKQHLVLRGSTSDIGAVVFSPAGDLLASSSDNLMHIWSTKNGDCRAVLRGHESAVTDMTFSNDSARVVSVSRDRTVRLWKTVGGNPTPVIRDHGKDLEHLTISPDARRVAIRAGPEVGLWDTRSILERRQLGTKGVWARTASFSRDGRFVCVASRGDRFRIWDAITGSRVLSLGTATDGASVAFSHDGRMLATSSGDEQAISLWLLGTLPVTALGRLVRRFTWQLLQRKPTFLVGAREHASICFSPDDRYIASPFYSGVCVWDLKTPGERLFLKGHRDSVRCVAFSPTGSRLVSGGGESPTQYAPWQHDNSVRLWSLETRRELIRLDGHTGPVTCVAFSPDGRSVASGSLDRTVRVWDAASGYKIDRLDGFSETVERVGFIAQGAILFANSRSRRICWRTSDFRETEKIRSTPLETAVHVDGDELPVLAYPIPLAHIERFHADESTILGVCANHLVALVLRGHREPGLA